MVAWDSDVGLVVEAGFGSDPLTDPITWTDISTHVRQVQTSRGRSRILDKVNAGEASVVLDNTDSRFNPLNTSGPYSPNVRVLTPIRVSAVHNLVTYRLFQGYATNWPQTYPGIKDAVTVVDCVDGFHLLAMVEQELTESEEFSGTRIGNLLDAAGWPAGWRTLDTGTHLVAGLVSEFNSVLGEIQRAELVEQGLFHIAGNGNATYRDANTRIQDDTIQATFSDDGAGLSYSLPQFDWDDLQLWNSATVTRAGGTAQTSTDAATVADYGERSLHLSETLHVADGEALALADWLVSEFKDVRMRMSSLTIYPMKDPANLWPVALGLDLWDKVNIERTPPSSSTLDFDAYVEGISHDISKTGGMHWDTTFQFSPDIQHDDWWILGTSQLGTDTRLGY